MRRGGAPCVMPLIKIDVRWGLISNDCVGCDMAHTLSEKTMLNEGKKVKGKSVLQTRSKTWHFVVNNYTTEQANALKDSTLPEHGIVGQEIAKTGTPHLQGFVKFKNAKTGSAVQKWIGGKCTVQLLIHSEWHNWNYCSKDCDILVQWGEKPDEPKTTNTHSDWDAIHSMVNEGMPLYQILNEMPHMTRYISAIARLEAEIQCRTMLDFRVGMNVVYLNGPAGVGKSRQIDAKHGEENVYRITNKKNPWDGYRGQPVVVFEEYRSGYGIETMLNWLDGYRLMLPCRYADRPARFTTVYLITNIELHEQFKNTQMDYHETWCAFLRRITKVVSFVEEGDSCGWSSWDTIRGYLKCKGYERDLKGLESMQKEPLNTLESVL